MRSGMACTMFLREYLRLSTTIVINDATYSAAIIPVTTLKSVMEYHIVSIQNMHVVSLKINSGNGVRLKIFCNIALTKSAAGSNVPNATAKIYPKLFSLIDIENTSSTRGTMIDAAAANITATAKMTASQTAGAPTLRCKTRI